jgi:hypothetical protein
MQSCEKKTTEKEDLVDDNELVTHAEDQQLLANGDGSYNQ